MFCPKCGTHLPEESEFCSNCGINLKEFQQQPVQQVDTTNMNHENNVNMSTNSSKTMTEMFSIKSKKFINPIINKIKKFCIKYKKQLCIGLATCFAIFIGILLFNKFYDFTKMSWDIEHGDANVTHTQSTTLTLNVLAYDKKKNQINDIKFSTENGKVVSDGAKVEWTLPIEAGEYTIVATAPSGKKIKKSVRVVELKDSDEKSHNLSGMIQMPEDEKTTDSDNDGLTNAEEKQLGTNIYSADSDADGLPDKLEIDETKTNPLKKDTDGDGINDGDEMDLGLDPLKADSKGDGIKDGERNLTYTIDENDLGISMQINGKGNIASSTIDIIKNSSFTNMDGLLDTIYNFYTTGKIESAVVTIKYSIDEISKKGLDENNLTLYYFDEETKKLEALPTTVDKDNKTITVTLKHFSKYVMGDSNVVLTNANSQIMFVIDNSVSMYSESQMVAAGYNNSQGAIGNDIEFKRLSLTNNMIDMFTGNYEFGVAEFSGNYVNLSKFTNDKAMVKRSVNSMKNKWNSDTNGTNIISALNQGIAEFQKDENSHYIVLLTDGKNTKGYLSSSKNTIINNAKEKNVKICVIGLGNNIDTNVLDNIAEQTGCDYYNAANASALDEIYSIVGADINYNLVDTDGDSKVDGMIQANSGFIVTRDGFSFSNFKSNKSKNGHCYGMATFAMLYYKKQLPLSLPAKDNSRFYLTSFSNIELASNGYNLNNTFISNRKNLYDYKITDEALKFLLIDVPGDYRDRVENNIWMIKKEYYDKLAKIGATFSFKDYTNGNEDFNKYQSALLNIDNNTFNNAVVKDESQLLDAIWRLYILQADAQNTSFSSEPDKAFIELNNELNNGTPVVLGIAGNHAINAIRLIQDIHDSNKFKIEVYDNNYPGETRYISVTRNKYSKFVLDYTAWTNEYNYTFTYDASNNGTAKQLSVLLSHPIVE